MGFSRELVGGLPALKPSRMAVGEAPIFSLIFLFYRADKSIKSSLPLHRMMHDQDGGDLSSVQAYCKDRKLV